LFGLALPIFLLACLGLVAKWRLPFTVATHLSPVYAGFLLFCWQVGVPTTKQASLGPIAVPSGAGLYVIATILGTCLLSLAVTHLFYVFAVGKEIRALVRWLGLILARRDDHGTASAASTRHRAPRIRLMATDGWLSLDFLGCHSEAWFPNALNHRRTASTNSVFCYFHEPTPDERARRASQGQPDTQFGPRTAST
jgi:hypothetical protein